MKEKLEKMVEKVDNFTRDLGSIKNISTINFRHENTVSATKDLKGGFRVRLLTDDG